MKCTYIQQDGSERTIEIRAGRTVRDGAITNLIPGIISECGGGCACATCHVYVSHEWTEKVGGPNDMEEEMLEFAAAEVKPESRLSCQIVVDESMDGLRVYIPDKQ